jgi:hypothetical protein
MKTNNIFLFIFKKNIILLITLITVHFHSIKSTKIEESKHCLIHNLKFIDDYLYNFKIGRDNIVTSRLNKVDDFVKVTWMFIAVKVNDVQIKINNKPIYLIKSGKYEDEYLCSTKKIRTGSLNRQLKKSKIKETDKFYYFNCYWSFDRVKLNRKIKSFDKLVAYSIKNAFFNEPLYIEQSGTKNLFLWPSNKPSTAENFKWVIDCSKGHH